MCNVAAAIAYSVSAVMASAKTVGAETVAPKCPAPNLVHYEAFTLWILAET